MSALLICLAFGCATVPALLWVWNMVLYREPTAGSCTAGRRGSQRKVILSTP